MPRDRYGQTKTVFDDVTKKRVYQLYVKQSLSMAKVSDRLSIPVSTLQGLLEKNNWVRRKSDTLQGRLKFQLSRPRIKNRYASLYKSGFTANDLAEHAAIEFGSPVMPNVFEQFVSKLGIKRTRSETAALLVYQKRHPAHYRRRNVIVSWLDMNLTGISYEEYYHAIQRLTDSVQDEFPQYIEGIDVVGKGDRTWHVDHAFSTHSGFYNDEGLVRSAVCPLHLMCHPVNLRVMTASENGRKGKRNSMSKDELIQTVRDFTQAHGNIFAQLKADR